ncbi:Uncharacterised protein [Anaerostipes hadrus]|uniref:TrbC/VIRB2 family protein n=1 Tax=Anaerostipes hadrus TaxID=649756 RepID=A0A174JPJ8_ANAHA|nr:hypothetical protein [Anaerostipes hadrus]CUO99090.1 Uncharacterised protein [Anaerostipes hadrus]
MNKIKEHAKYLAFSFISFFNLIIIPSFAGDEQQAVKEVDKLIDKLYAVVGYAGTLIAIYACGMLIFSFKSENYDAVGKHIMQLCVAITLIGLKTFMN